MYKAYGELLANFISQVDPASVNFNMWSHTFSPDEKRTLRKRPWSKDQQDVRNIYNKKPKALGNRCIASLQINVSLLSKHAYTDDKGVKHSEVYGLLDVPRIVQALDEAFKAEIVAAGRQPGEYCIKGDRLEYRSLPNFAFQFGLQNAKSFLEKIEKAVEK